MMLGGGAKGSAKVAIGAMTGMMKGWPVQAARTCGIVRSRRLTRRGSSAHQVFASTASTKTLIWGLKQLATDREAGRAKLVSAAWRAGDGWRHCHNDSGNGRAQDALRIARDGYELSSDIDKRVQDVAIAQRRHEEAQALRRQQIASSQAKAAAPGRDRSKCFDVCLAESTATFSMLLLT
jgi:hypothetical protein